MKALRTPDEYFTNLPDYPFEPNYAQIPDGEGGLLRMHYLDVGPRRADPVLLLHGEPSWSYLYRKMIPIITAAGYRALAPDLVGFGRSDKPFLTAFSDGDPITRGGERLLQKTVPGAKGQPHTTIKGGGHFLQEDCGEELARVVVGFMQATGSDR